MPLSLTNRDKTEKQPYEAVKQLRAQVVYLLHENSAQLKNTNNSDNLIPIFEIIFFIIKYLTSTKLCGILLLGISLEEVRSFYLLSFRLLRIRKRFQRVVIASCMPRKELLNEPQDKTFGYPYPPLVTSQRQEAQLNRGLNNEKAFLFRKWNKKKLKVIISETLGHRDNEPQLKLFQLLLKVKVDVDFNLF